MLPGNDPGQSILIVDPGQSVLAQDYTEFKIGQVEEGGEFHVFERVCSALRLNGPKRCGCAAVAELWFYNGTMLMEGIFAAVPTPFYPDERVYFRKLEANIARYSRSLLSGMVLLGSTGEAVALNDQETLDVLRIAAEAAAPDKVLIAGVGKESVKATVELAEAAAKHRYDAVLVRTPTYYSSQMSAAAVLHYFRSMADRSPLPVLLYNIPRCVPYSIPIEVIAELAFHPNIIGIKDSSGSVERIKAARSNGRSPEAHSDGDADIRGGDGTNADG